MAVLQRILDVLSQRIASLVGGALASRLETMVVLEQVDQQDELEECARRLEKEGKTHLAEAVRQRMLDVDHSNPGSQGQSILTRLCDETTSESNPALLEHKTEETEPKPKNRNVGVARPGEPATRNQRARGMIAMSSRNDRAETAMRALTRQVGAVSLDQMTRIVRSVHGDDAPVGSLLGWLHDQGMIETASIAIAYPRVRRPILAWRRKGL